MDQNQKSPAQSPSSFWEQMSARRTFLKQSLNASLAVSASALFMPLQSLATGLNIGAFWRKRKTSGTLWLWGYNPAGQIGDGTIVPKSSPVQIGSLNSWAEISSGREHTLAIKMDGTLWAWGKNTDGQLGTNTTTFYSSPIQIGALDNWKQVSASYHGHSAGVRYDGTLWIWGRNSWGQLGKGDTAYRSSPVQVGTLNDWKTVACGNLCTIALRNNGTMWAWGYNALGQVGDGTSAHKSSPVQVGSLTTWREISSTFEYALALRSDGTLWAWGSNFHGQLGDLSRTNRSSPVQVGSATNWLQVSAGVNHSSGLQRDGTLWAWGSNYAGQVPIGATGSRSSPVQIGALTDWVQVQAYYESGLGLRSNGTLWAWGENNVTGDLGTGNMTNRSSPVLVGSSPDVWVKLGTGGHVSALKAK